MKGGKYNEQLPEGGFGSSVGYIAENSNEIIKLKTLGTKSAM